MAAFKWFLQPWFMRCVVLLAIVTTAILLWRSEPLVRLLGLGLQLLGAGVVLFDLHGRLRLFGVDVWEAVERWWQSRPFGSKRMSVGTANAGLKGASVRGYATSRLNLAGMPIEEALAALQRRLEQLGETDAALAASIDKVRDELQDALRKERAERESALSTLTDTVREASTSGWQRSAAASIWIICGLILGTASREICDYLPRCAGG